MKKRKKVEALLNDYSDILKVLPLERRLGFSRGKIYKFFKNNRKLSVSEINKIDDCIQNMIEKYLE